jgi:hypothetical protein
MSKQTAVEWLVEQFEKYYVFRDLKNTIVYQQAKAMEKEQMIKFANDFLFHDNTDLTAEQYYNETFKK